MSQEPGAGGGTSWLRADFDGKPIYFWLLLSAAIAVVVLGFGALWGDELRVSDDAMGAAGDMSAADGGESEGMQAMEPADAPVVPAVFGYYAGEDIRFIHTEASDAQVADMLTMMMGSPVLLVPSLSEVPPTARANVYVFANGRKPDDTPLGPLGFQPDVFDSAPGDAGYSPLREIVRVSWSDGAEPRVLQLAEEIEAAEQAGELTLEQTGAVVNMPMLTWPGGER